MATDVTIDSCAKCADLATIDVAMDCCPRQRQSCSSESS